MCHYLNMFKEPQACDYQAMSITKADSAVLCSFADLASWLSFNSSEIIILKQYLCSMADTVNSDEFFLLLITTDSDEHID